MTHLQLDDFLVLTLVIWRVSHLTSSEDGPFDIIVRLRKLFGDSTIGKLMDCFYCVSVWTALILASIVEHQSYLELLINTLSLSGAAIIVNEVLSYLKLMSNTKKY